MTLPSGQSNLRRTWLKNHSEWHKKSQTMRDFIKHLFFNIINKPDLFDSISVTANCLYLKQNIPYGKRCIRKEGGSYQQRYTYITFSTIVYMVYDGIEAIISDLT